MKKYCKLTKKERKDEIMNKSLELFLEKGISQTTMTDIIKASNLSRGGVYNHYNSKEEILHDLLIKGSNRRLNITRIALKTINNATNDMEEVLTELMIDKMFDKSEYHKLYGMFLYETKFNEKFKEMYKDIEKETTKTYIDFFNSEEFNNLDLGCFKKFTNKKAAFVFNSLFLGKDLFDCDNEEEKKELIIFILNSYLQYVTNTEK